MTSYERQLQPIQSSPHNSDIRHSKDLQLQRPPDLPDLPDTLVRQLNEAIQDLIRTGVGRQSLQVGDHAPNFSLPNADGTPISLQRVLTRGPAIISFYRGTWCPYCNTELTALQAALPAIEHLGATLIALSPQRRSYGQQLITEQEITYSVLVDADNQVATQFGLVFDLAPEVDQLYQQMGISVREHNLSRRAALPVPATYVIKPDGEIAFAFVNPDYTQRLDPVELITILRQLTA